MDQEQYDFPSPSGVTSKKGVPTSTKKSSTVSTKDKKVGSKSFDFPSPSEFSGTISAPVAEKKKTLELPSRQVQEPTSLVTKKEVAPTPSASSTQEKPIETPLVGTEGELLRAPSKAYFEGYPEKKATVKELLKAPKPIAAPDFSGGVSSTGGELLRAPKMNVIPAETEVVTTYKKIPIPSKTSALNPKQKIDRDTMLDAIALHESGAQPGENRVGMRTKMRGKAGRASASGTYQFVTGTLKGIYDQTDEYKQEYGTFENFKKTFDKDPNLERDVAGRYYDQFQGLGVHAPGAWYAPALAEQAARGNKSALRQVPGREYGNKTTYGGYLKGVMSIYNKLLGNKVVEGGSQKYKTVEVKKEVVKQPEVTLPSNDQYDVTKPEFYNVKEDINFLSKDVLQKSKKIATDIKSFEQQRVAFERDATNFEAMAKANPADPSLPAMQQTLLKTQQQLQAQEVSLRKNAESVDVDQFQLRKKALENYKRKAEEGNWGGWLWNKAISGLEAMSGGLDDQLGLWKTLGAQTLDLFGIKSDELEKKPWLLAAGGDMYRRQATKEMQARHIGALESMKDKSTTEEYATEMEKSGIIPAALGGLFYSAPAMVGGLPMMIMQSIGATRKEMETNKDMPYMTESEKDFVAVPIAIATGFLEEAGLNAVLKGGKGPIVKLLGKVAQSIPENSTMDVIRKAIVEAGEKLAATGIAKGVKKVAATKIGKIGTRLTGGALGEAETESEQGIAEKEWKRFSNKLMGMEAFKVASMESKEYWDQVAQDAKVGAVGALILGGPMVGIKTVFEGKSVTDDDYIAMSSLINDPEYAKLQKANIALNLASGKITKEQADVEVKALEKAKSIMAQIPTDIPVASQRKAFELITANNKIQAEMDNMSKSIVGKDPNLVTAVIEKIKEKQALIDKNNQELSKLPQNAVQEQTTSEVPVQPEAGGRVQMAEGEPQAEPQVPTQESQREEIERRRKEELDQYANNLIVKTEVYEDGEGRRFLVHTLKNGKKRLDSANEDNKRTGTLEVYDGSVPVENYITEPTKIEEIEVAPSKQENRINEKYDAEIAALEEVAPTQETKTEEVKPTEEGQLDELGDKPTPEVEQAAKKSGVPVTGVWSMFKVNKKVFGLNNVQALASAIAIDRVVGTIAKRSGKTKEQVYKSIDFQKGDISQFNVAVQPGRPVIDENGNTLLYQRKDTVESLEDDISWNDQAIEELEINDIAGSLENIKEAKERLDQEVEKVKASSMSSSDKKEAIQELKDEYKNEVDTSKDWIKTFKEQIAKLKSENNKYRRRIEKLKNPKAKEEIVKKEKQQKEQVDKLAKEAPVPENPSAEKPAEQEKNKWSKNPTLEKFLNELSKLRSLEWNMLFPDKLNYGNGAVLQFSTFNKKENELELQTLISIDKGKGVATQVMKDIASIADKNGVELTLFAQPFGDWTDKLGIRDLVNFYMKSGFVIDPEYMDDFEFDSKEEAIAYAEKYNDGIRMIRVPQVNGLFQESAGGVQGAMQIGKDGKAIIYALSNPNVSTPLHELAHVYENYLTDKEKANILSWTGQKEWNRETSEKFARGFEKYLSDGKAPSNALKEIFDQFKEWLLDIYNGIVDSEIDIELNDKMRDIYDAMLSESEVNDNYLLDVVKSVLEGQRFKATNQRIKDFVAKWRESEKELTPQDIIGIIPMTEARATRIANSLSDRLNKAENKKKAAEEKAKQEKKVMLPASILSSMVKALKEGMTTDLIAVEGVKALKRLKRYKTMSEQERQAITDEINKKAGVPRPAAPSAQQVLGIESTQELVDEMEVLKEKLGAREESAEGGAVSAKEAVNSMIDAVKRLGAKGILTSAQMNSLLSGLKEDMTNPITRARFFDKAEKIIKNAIYAETLSKAVAIREQIRRLAGNKNLIDDVKQAALEFARLSPSMVEDIDEYMENAQQFYDAIKTPRVTPKGGANFRQATDINERLEYINRESERQMEAMKGMLLDNYNNLVDLGVISADISLKEIKEIIAAIEKGEPVEGAEEVIEATRELIKLEFKNAAEVAAKMLSGKHPLTGETVTFSPEVKQLVKNFLEMDLDKLSTDQLYQSLDAVNNLIVNEYVNKMGAIYNSYAGTLEGNITGKRLGGKGNFKRAILTVLGRIPAIRKFINKRLDPIETLLAGYFKSDDKARTFMTASKLYDIINMHSKAIKMVNNISKDYVASFGKMKANGKKFMNALNVYERGIYADLLRSVIGTPKEVQDDFNDKMDLLKQTIETNKKSGDKRLIEKAKLYEQVYEKIKDAKNAEEVGKLVDPVNKQGAEFWVGKWAESYDLFATIASTIYNKKINKEDFYTPEGWEKIVPYETTQDLNAMNTYKMAFNFINQSPVSTMMDRQNKKKLPSQGEGDIKETTYVKDYDFDINNATKLRKTMLDLLTASSVQHLMGFINSKGFNEMFPDVENRTFAKEKIYTMVNLLRDREYDDSAAEWKSANDTMTYFASVARSAALTSALAPIQQTIPVFIGTIINTVEELPSLLVGQVPSFAKGFGYVTSPSFNKAINNSGYGISLRGLDSVASLGASDTILTSAAESGAKKFFEALRGLNDAQLKFLLSKPDVIAARGAWASYYVYKLRKMGLPTNDIDWSKPLNKEAADFAESKVNQTLNSSVQETLGEMFASKKASNKLLRNTIFAFASFSINMKAQINKDLLIIGSLNSSLSDKAEAGKDLLRISGEAYIYSQISGSIMNYVYDKLFELYGVKESEEDKKKRRDNKTNSAITRGYTDMMSPIPGAGDELLIYATNYLLGGKEIKEKLPEEKLYFAKTKRAVPENKFLFYEKDSNSDAEAYLNLVGGLAGVPAGNISNVTANTMLLNDVYKDKDGTILKLTQEEKDNLTPWVKGQTTSVFGIGLRQTGEIANKLAKQYIKNAKARAAQRKKERLYFAK